MSTFDALQQLPDGAFHHLGDQILRRLDPKYRRLRPHGINDRGESIKGQPDSYVGDTAQTCKIAVCYTTERKAWWNKIVDDIKEARAASPLVEEIVSVLPRDVDREGPKGTKKRKKVDWLANAKAAAGNATYTLLDGRTLARLLDADHQDLRYDHLRIPYSRLTPAGILASGRKVTVETLNAIRASGRYDPERYAGRSADRELFSLWQTCLREYESGSSRTAPVRLIALVNDSGVGKTSLVCAFVESLCEVLPVLLVQARDLVLDSAESLVTTAIHALQGVLDPAVRANEEHAIAKHLADGMPLTFVVDGLDESHDPEGVRKAITFWLQSRLGQQSVLVLTSRPEFWRVCFTPQWRRWMPVLPREARPTTESHGFAPQAAIEASGETRLPGLFSDEELEAAWLRGGRSIPDLYGLRREVREELHHPFTLRAFLETYGSDTSPTSTLTRSDLLETWLNRRLEAEARPEERITPDLLQQSLRLVTRLLDATSIGSLSVDDLTQAPRFDRAHPPGPVVQRLVNANILETLPGRADRIRFSVEAVQDFYRADLDVATIHDDSAGMAAQLARLTFTEAYPRLVRIGRQLGEGQGRAFLEQLSGLDARRAATVLSVDPKRYPSELRKQVVSGVAKDIASEFRVLGAFAVSVLGGLDCPESVSALEDALLPESIPHQGVNYLGAEAFLKLSAVAAARFVYRWEWLDDHYFPEKLAMFRQAGPEFRSALADCALSHLGSSSGTPEHRRAVCALGYLADDRLVDHLRTRLGENGILQEYENHALIALGSEAAAEFFVHSVKAVTARLSEIPDDGPNNDRRFRLSSSIETTKYDLRYLLTQPFIQKIHAFVLSEEEELWRIGMLFARTVPIPSLIYDTVVRSADMPPGWFTMDSERIQSVVTPEIWIGWWNRDADPTIRKALLNVRPLYPTAGIETVLIDCLESVQMRGGAAQALGRYASVRSAPFLRHILAEAPSDEGWWGRMAAADALGRLRDQDAIPVLRAVAGTDPSGDVAGTAITSIGFVGTPDAEATLRDLLRAKIHPDSVVEALLLCGTPSAVALAIEEAKNRPHGWRWLCECLGHCSWRRGWRRGEYHTHIDTLELTEYIDAQFQAGTEQENWNIVHWLREIDTPDVRGLLRKWASRRGTDQDPPATNGMMSDLCFAELASRGDEFAVPWVLDRPEPDDSHYLFRARHDLEPFDATVAAAGIKQRLLAANDDNTVIRRMLALLGRLGTAADGEIVRPFLDNRDRQVANIACESLLRLTDPLLVPDRW